MATVGFQSKPRSISTSGSATTQSDSASLLDGLNRSLPGLDRFLKIELQSQALSSDVQAELERLTTLLGDLEKTAGRDGEQNGLDRPDGLINGDSTMQRIDAAFSGFLAQAIVKGLGFVSWNRRWAVLKHDDTVLQLFRTRAESKPIMEYDMRGCRVTVADPHECGEKALTLKVTNPESDQPVFFCTYVESEYQKCMRALAAATGVQHRDEDFVVPTTSSAMTKVMNTVSVGSGRCTPDMSGSVKSSGSAFLDANEGAIDSTYDVPRPNALSASREQLDSAGSSNAEKRLTKYSISNDSEYSEIHVDAANGQVPPERPAPAQKKRRDPTEAVPDLPPRSFIGQATASELDAKNEESNYESLPFGNEDHGSNSDSSDRSGIYEDLEVKEGDTGYRSSDSTTGTSILGWFRRSTAERNSSRVEKTRKHRRSVAANELTDCDQDGYLFKRSSTGLTWKRRWCVLKERAFYYYRARDDGRAQNTIILPSWNISPASDEVKRPFAFKLSHEGMPAYFFAAETQDEYCTWMEVVKQSLRVMHNYPVPESNYDYPPPRNHTESDAILKAVQGLGGSPEDEALETYQVPRSHGSFGNSVATPSTGHPLGADEDIDTEENVYNVPRPSSADQPPPLPTGPRPAPKPRKKANSVLPMNEDSPGEDATQYDKVPLPNAAVDGRQRDTSANYGSSTNNNEVDTTGTFERGGVYNSLSKRAKKLVGRSKSASSASRAIVHTADRTIQGCLNVRGSYRWGKHFCELRQQRFFVYKGLAKDDKTVVHELRVLGMKVEQAEKETKRKNSFCLVKRRGGHQARAVYFYCEDEEDYKLWFMGLAEATMIRIQPVEDVSTIHKGGKAAPTTVGLAEARRRLTSSGDTSVDSGVSSASQGASALSPEEPRLRRSDYESGITLKTGLPDWLQEEVKKRDSTTEDSKTGSDYPLFQGYLQKRSGPAMWHPRYCIIENGNLACYAQKGSQIPTQVQPLANCSVTSSSKDRMKNVFKVVPPSPFPALYFSCEDQREVFEWVSYIKIASSASDSRVEGKSTRASVAVGQSFRASGRHRGKERALSIGDAPRRGFFSRIRSWSVENLSFGRRRSGAGYESEAEPEPEADATYGGSVDFGRNAVSLGHGPFRRSRRGVGKKKVVAKGTPANSGVLRIDETSGSSAEYVSRWCEVKQLVLNIHEQEQSRKMLQSIKLPGCTVMVHSADASEDQVIQLTPLAGKHAIRVRVPGSEEDFRSWLECFRTSASLANGPKRSWRDSFRRKRPVRAPSPEVAEAAKRQSLVGDHTSAPGPYALYETGSPDVLPGYASMLASDLNAMTAQHQGSSKAKAPQPPTAQHKTLPIAASTDETDSKSRANRSSTKPKAPSAPLQRSNATDIKTPTPTTTPLGGTSLGTSPRKIPNIPARKESIPTSPLRSASNPSASAADKMKSAPRFGAVARSNTAPPSSPPVKPKPSVAPKPSGAGERSRLAGSVSSLQSPAAGDLPELPATMPGIDNKVFSNLKQRYAAKAEAITTQSHTKQATLSKERADINRQQSELQQKLNACRSRIASTSGNPAMDVRREEAELQNKAGYLESRHGRINDQMMRNTTELKSAMDRLERERDMEIKKQKGRETYDSTL